MNRKSHRAFPRARRLGRVGVLMGGWSAERDVSLQSGETVFAALQQIGVDAVPIDLRQESAIEQITQGHFDRCFILVHGTGGEDGTLQGVLELLGIPYTGSGVLGSALSMDKWRCKQIWQAQGLPVVPGELLPAAGNEEAIVARLGLPLFVKPSREGSSVGITKVKHSRELSEAYRIAARFHGEVMVEPALPGGDYTVAILGDEALPAIRIEPASEFYDYAAKYSRNDTRYFCPCGLSESEEKALRELALNAFFAVGGRGWGRVDFLFDATGKPFLAEVNTVPGMTAHSLVPMAARATGMDMPELALKILEQTLPLGVGNET